MSDIVLAMSALFFMSMVTIPLWGPSVFFPERKERERKCKEDSERRAKEHEEWMANWQKKMDDYHISLAQMREDSNSEFRRYLLAEFEKQRGAEKK